MCLTLVLSLLFIGKSVRANTAHRLFFVSDSDGNHEICSSNATGGDYRNLSQDAGNDNDPALSSDGSHLAWTRDGNIWTMKTDGSEQRQSTTTGADSAPSWTPNNSQIISSPEKGKTQVFVMDVDGSARSQVLWSDANAEKPIMGAQSRTPTSNPDTTPAPPSPEPTQIPAQPEVVSLSPKGATDVVGSSRTWSVTVRDDNGVSDISSVWFMASRVFDWNSGVTLMYLPQSRQLCLRDNDAWSAPISPGRGFLESGRVFVDGKSLKVNADKNGKTLTVSFALRIKGALSGTNSLWTRVEDSKGYVDAKAGRFGFVAHDTWNVGVDGVGQSPIATVSPGARGQIARLRQGEETEVTLDLRDGNGSDDIESGWIEVGTTFDARRDMTFFVDAASKKLYLHSIKSDKWLGGDIVGQGKGTLENDLVSIRLNGCSLSMSPDGLRLHITLTPKSALVGKQKVWTRVTDFENHIGSDANCLYGFTTQGTWQVQGPLSSSNWQTSFLPATTSSLASPMNFFGWDSTAGKLNPVFNWKGGIPEQAGPGSTGVWRHILFYEEANALAMEFETDAPQWELYCNATGNGWRVLVSDGRATSWQVLGSWKPPAGGEASVQVFRQTKGVRQKRRWRIEYASQLAIGIRINRGDSITQNPASPPLPRVVWCGDSFTEGMGAASMWEGFSAQASVLLGLDPHFDASGGTGYVTDGPPSWHRTRYGNRISNIVQAQPDVVIVYGGANDGNADPQKVAAAAKSFWKALHKALPRAKIVAISPVQSSNYWKLGPLAQTLQKTAATSDVIFLNATFWINGTGNESAPHGDGNADAFISSDGVHPSPAGHAFLAQKIADALRPLLNPTNGGP